MGNISEEDDLQFRICFQHLGRGWDHFIDWTTMHQSVRTGSGVGVLPAMYSFSGPTSLPQFDFGAPRTSDDLKKVTLYDSWETRCLRKNRRRADDEACSAKKRRLTMDFTETSCSNPLVDWPSVNCCPPPELVSQQDKSGLVAPVVLPENQNLMQPLSVHPEMDSFCMEIEAAQRKLQEIEDRITLEDDFEDEDLGVEPAPRRPVLVISDSLKEGLQRGITDILPHTVVQSVSHSCMELVLWRPPDELFSRKQKNSLQKLRKQQTTVSHQPLTPCSSPNHQGPSSPPADTHSCLYSFPVAHSSGEEDMEM